MGGPEGTKTPQGSNIFTRSLYCKKHKDVTVVGLSFILEPAITSKYVPFVGQYIMWRKCRIKSTKVNLKVDYVIFWRFSQFMVVGNLIYTKYLLLSVSNIKQRYYTECCLMLGCQLDIARAIFSYI